MGVYNSQREEEHPFSAGEPAGTKGGKAWQSFPCLAKGFELYSIGHRKHRRALSRGASSSVMLGKPLNLSSLILFLYKMGIK